VFFFEQQTLKQFTIYDSVYSQSLLSTFMPRPVMYRLFFQTQHQWRMCNVRIPFQLPGPTATTSLLVTAAAAAATQCADQCRIVTDSLQHDVPLFGFSMRRMKANGPIRWIINSPAQCVHWSVILFRRWLALLIYCGSKVSSFKLLILRSQLMCPTLGLSDSYNLYNRTISGRVIALL